MKKILEYSPKIRLTPLQALAHEYFDDLRDKKYLQKISEQGLIIPNLFDFS